LSVDCILKNTYFPHDLFVCVSRMAEMSYGEGSGLDVIHVGDLLDYLGIDDSKSRQLVSQNLLDQTDSPHYSWTWRETQAMSSYHLYLQVAVVAIVVLLLVMIALMAWNCVIIRMLYNTSSHKNSRFHNTRRKRHFESENKCKYHVDSTEISILTDNQKVMEHNYDE